MLGSTCHWSAGVFSALGLLYAEVETGVSAACLRRIDAISDDELETRFTRLEHGIAEELSQPAERIAMTRSADLRYVGQAFELTLPLGDHGPYDAAALDAIRERFDAAHIRSYGYRLPGVAVEIVTLRAQGRLLQDEALAQPCHAMPCHPPPLRGGAGRGSARPSALSTRRSPAAVPWPARPFADR